MSFPIAAKNRLEIRHAIGYNLGALIVGAVTDTKDTTSLWDTIRLARYGDDDLNGAQVQINTPAGSIVSGEQSYVSDFADANEDCTMSPAFTQNLTALDTYEMWLPTHPYDIAQVNNHINQAIVAASDDIVINKTDSTTLIKKDKEYEYTVPTGFVGIHTVEYVDKVGVDILLDDCEEAWTAGSANVTVTADSSIERVGTYCAKMVEDGNSAAGANIGYIAISSTDLSDCDRIEFWMYSSIALTAGQLDFALDDTAALASVTESLDVPAMSAATWYRHSIALANPQSDTAIISIGLVQTSDVGAATYYIDDVRAVKDKSKVYKVLNPENWGIVQASTKLLQLDETAYSQIELGRQLRLSGYAVPDEFTGDSTDSTIDPDYIVAKATSTLLLVSGGGREIDPDDNMKKSEMWMGIAERRLLQSRTTYEMNTRWCA